VPDGFLCKRSDSLGVAIDGESAGLQKFETLKDKPETRTHRALTNTAFFKQPSLVFAGSGAFQYDSKLP
jgi:hypothetical protein